MVPVPGRSAVEAVDATIQPAVGQFHGLLGVPVIGRTRGAFVERHDDVGSDATLGVHHVFRGEQMPGAVDV